MANLYTSSPLGLIDDINIIYQDNNGKLDTLFSSYKDGQNKHFLRRSSKGFRGILSQSPHSDEIYDISTTNIIERLKGIPHLQLRYGDFAYLHDYGVYPNNRLIVLRRFRNGIKDDLYAENGNLIGAPLATVIGYVKEDNFLDFSFSEEWERSETSFKEIFNDIGKDFRLDKFVQLGDYLAGGMASVPLPGATELIQRRLMAALGIITDNGEEVEYKNGQFVNKGTQLPAQVPAIPIGDPNLIKEAQRRKTGSDTGLKGKFNVTLKVKYEQKFLNGNDPTLVYADILHNLLSMGTSRSTFYLGKNTDAANDLSKFYNDLYKDPLGKIGKILDQLVDALEQAKKTLVELANKVADATTSAAEGDISKAKDLGTSLVEGVINTVKSAINGTINFLKNKYRIKILGVINALTGAPSTPWHVTIGNPLRPIFCSGDMLCTDVKVTLGQQLSFNDLPTFIEATITLTSARNLGSQEIFAKLNAGGIRTTEGTNSLEDYDYSISISEDFWSTTLGQTSSGFVFSEVNFQGEQLTSGLEFVSQAITSQTIDVTNTQNLNNTSSTKVPGAPITIPILNITSLQSVSMINPDPLSSDFILDAGQMAESETLRENETQDLTGSLEGFESQVAAVTETPNDGLESEVPTILNEQSSQNYNYAVKNFGSSTKYVEVTDDSGNIVYSGDLYTNAEDELLIQEARIALNVV